MVHKKTLCSTCIFSLIFALYNTLIGAVCFTDTIRVRILKNILDPEMYEASESTITINDTNIGLLFKELFETKNGFLLLEKLEVLSKKLNCRIKILKPLGSIAGLQKMTVFKYEKWVWTLNYSQATMPRIIAIKNLDQSYDFHIINVPSFIILAHELLHYLLRLETLTPGIKFIERSFITNNQSRISDSTIIQLYGTTKTASGQAYDELSVIVGHEYKIQKDCIFLSETLFLQEYLGTSNCFLCYGHSPNLKSELLTTELANQVIKLSLLKGKIVTEAATEGDLEKIASHIVRKKSALAIDTPVVTKKVDPSITVESRTLLNDILQTHELHNVLGDGNCGIYAILQGANPSNLPHEIVQGLDYNFSIPEGSSREDMTQWQNAKKLREFLFSEGDPRREMATGLSDQNLQIRELQNFDLSHIAQRLEQDILFFSDGVKMAVLYHANGNIDIIKNPEELPSDVSTCICLYHSGNHFQAIVPKGK